MYGPPFLTPEGFIPFANQIKKALERKRLPRHFADNVSWVREVFIEGQLSPSWLSQTFNNSLGVRFTAALAEPGEYTHYKGSIEEPIAFIVVSSSETGFQFILVLRPEEPFVEAIASA